MLATLHLLLYLATPQKIVGEFIVWCLISEMKVWTIFWCLFYHKLVLFWCLFYHKLVQIFLTPIFFWGIFFSNFIFCIFFKLHILQAVLIWNSIYPCSKMKTWGITWKEFCLYIIIIVLPIFLFVGMRKGEGQILKVFTHLLIDLKFWLLVEKF